MVKAWLEITLAELLLDTIVCKNYFMQRIQKHSSSLKFLIILPSARRREGDDTPLYKQTQSRLKGKFFDESCQ